MIGERCDALAARAIQLQAHTAELLCRMGELNTHVTTGQAILSDVNARNAASPRPGQSLPAMDDTSATAQYVAQSRLPLMHSSNQMAATLGSGTGSPVVGASAPPALPVFEACESTANSAAPRDDNDTYFDDGDRACHCETPLCSGSRPLDKTARPNRSFILRHATSIQRINEGAVHRAGSRGDAHAHESGLRSKLTPPECSTTPSLVAPDVLKQVAEVPVAMTASKSVCITVAISTLKFLHRARAERDYLLPEHDGLMASSGGTMVSGVEKDRENLCFVSV